MLGLRSTLLGCHTSLTWGFDIYSLVLNSFVPRILALSCQELVFVFLF